MVDVVLGDDYTLSTTTITMDATQIPPTGSHLLACIPVSPGGGGGGGAEIVDYVEKTTNTSITATAEGSADTIVTGAGFTADGTSTYVVAFYSAALIPDNGAAGRNLTLVLYEDGSSIGRIATMQTPSAAFMDAPFYAERHLVPSSGTRTYSIRGIVNAGTGTVSGGAGGSGNFVPAFIKVTKVV